MMSIKKKTLRIPMNERLYGRKGCRVIAEKLLETGRIVNTGTGKDLLNDDSVKKAYLGG